MVSYGGIRDRTKRSKLALLAAGKVQSFVIIALSDESLPSSRRRVRKIARGRPKVIIIIIMGRDLQILLDVESASSDLLPDVVGEEPSKITRTFSWDEAYFCG